MHYHRKSVVCSSCGQEYLALRAGEHLEDLLEGQAFTEPKCVGYWSPEGPDPRDLVAQDFYGAELPLVVAYLKAGRQVMRYLGYSHCRFCCGILNRDMGTSDLSDGEWVWPEGLWHYVEAHSVRLPPDFVSTMRDNRWQPPQDRIKLRPFGRIYDSSFWRSWAAQEAGHESSSEGLSPDEGDPT